MKSKRHNTKLIQTLSLLKMPAITRNQMKNSINNVPIVNLVKDVIPIRECAKGISYSNNKNNSVNGSKSGLAEIDRKLRNNKRIDYSNMDMPTSILAKHTDSYYWCSNWNNFCDIVLDQLVYESRDPDYIFEEDYDDDELEESVNLDLENNKENIVMNIDDETMNNIKNMKEFKIKILEKKQAKNIEQNNKENIVMNIDDETMNNIKNMKEFKTKILEKKQAKNVTYIPGAVNSVKDIIPTRECSEKNIFVSIDQAEINYIRSLPGFKNRVYIPGGVSVAKDGIPTRKCAKNISYRQFFDDDEIADPENEDEEEYVPENQD